MLNSIRRDPDAGGALDFLWLELTNRCNLQCVHCYAESGPYAGDGDTLTSGDYQQLIDEAIVLGCRKIQFIGGEPTLNPALPALVAHAASGGITFIEVFTNLVRLPEPLIGCFRRHSVRIATSVYSYGAATHDRITRVPGSFARTCRNISRLVKAGVSVRAGFIEMGENASDAEAALKMLRAMGVADTGRDRLRAFGRGNHKCENELSELCGSCAGATLCIGPDGSASPCIMSKSWPVGSIREASLREIAQSEHLAHIRDEIGAAVFGREASLTSLICAPKTCGPYNTCGPQTGNPCAPSGCNPCYPQG